MEIWITPLWLELLGLKNDDFISWPVLEPTQFLIFVDLYHLLSFLHFFCWTPADSSNYQLSGESCATGQYCGQHATLVPRINGVLVILSLLGWEPNFHTDNQTYNAWTVFRHCLENGGTMGYCSRSPLSNPGPGTYCEQLTLEDLKPIHFGEYLKPSKTSISTPKKMLKSVSRMVVPWYFSQSFQVSIFSIVWEVYYTNHQTCWGNYDFAKWCLKGWILQRIQFQIAIQKTERPTNMEKEQTTMDR